MLKLLFLFVIEVAAFTAAGVPPPAAVYGQPLPPYPTYQLPPHPNPLHHPTPAMMYGLPLLQQQQPQPPLNRSTGGTSVKLDDLFAAAKRSSQTNLFANPNENALSAAPVRRQDEKSTSKSGMATSPAKINSTSGSNIATATATAAATSTKASRLPTAWTTFHFDQAQILQAMQSSK